MVDDKELLTIQEASEWASNYLGRDVSTSNISYLVQYGRVKRYSNHGLTQVAKQDLVRYYKSHIGERELEWKNELGEDLNWALSFDNLAEKERTKHVHRLHPYKGKFIPQLVEYFLDKHTDEFKNEIFFKPGDIVLDPFCGSGTTLVQANELGIHAIGVDISAFNAMISNVKVGKHNLYKLHDEIRRITIALKESVAGKKHVAFETELAESLTQFNNLHFPTPEFKYRVRRGEIDQVQYGREKESEFRKVFDTLVLKYNFTIRQEKGESFLDQWFIKPVREEIEFVFEHIQGIQDIDIKKILAVILSRTMRSCRATTHADLATLVDPIFSTYYCRKHGKICKPLFSILSWWERYSKDTLQRLAEFHRCRTATFQHCFTGDSRTIDIFSELQHKDKPFADFAVRHKINGIFSSPPYVGLIDYHEQHAYAYDLFKFERRDELEIGPLYKGQGREAQESYVEGIAEVLRNSRNFLVDDYNIFLVANDKYDLYPQIAEKAGMDIINEFKRPVLCRTEKNKMPYSEKIFLLKGK
ncbi:MAG: DNA methyltransferase [Chloroflexota bacterium]